MSGVFDPIFWLTIYCYTLYIVIRYAILPLIFFMYKNRREIIEFLKIKNIKKLLSKYYLEIMQNLKFRIKNIKIFLYNKIISKLVIIIRKLKWRFTSKK